MTRRDPAPIHSATLVVLVALACFSGCSQQESNPVATTPANPPASKNSASIYSSADEIAAAEAVIGQFLDRVRRGGGSEQAERLLTDKARAELARIGQPIQPIGSPSASFKITRSESAPLDAASDETDQTSTTLAARLVHCIWSEPTGDPANPTATEDYQVVWAVERQSEGWRISGLVLETSPGEPPLVLDFENGEAMAKMLADQSGEAAAASSVPQTAENQSSGQDTTVAR